MSVRFPTLALAAAHTSYRANEDVWIGGGATLGDEVSGYYVFRRGANTPAGPGVIVVPNGRLERTSDPNAQFDALAVRTAERLRPDLNDLEARIGTMELTLSNALINLPAQVAEHLKTGDPLSIAGEVSAVGGASAADIGTEVAAKVNGLPAGVAWIRTTTVSGSSGTTTLNGVGSNGTAYTRTISESGDTTTISAWVPA